MNTLLAFWRSSIGKKIVMAVTGIIGIGFVIAHILGNMLVFKGSAAMDAYGHFLHSTAAEALWIARIVLIVSVILHVIAAYQLTRQSHAARPDKYAKREPQVSTYASRLMRWGGVILLAFIIFHILHFTTGTVQPEAGGFKPGQPYENIVASFRIWWVSLFYLISMAFLGLHLYHGAWASFRTIGATGRSPRPLHRNVAVVIATFVWLGFSIIPVAVLLGWLK
jgi:succinate dehydrogenase / fumarate reductase cytochrome b subunit